MAKKGILRINNFGHLSNFTCILRYENFLITSLRHIKHSKYCKCVFLRIACKTTVKIRYANRRVRQTLFALCVALLMFIFNTTESCVNLMKHSSGNHIYSRVSIGAFFFYLQCCFVFFMVRCPIHVLQSNLEFDRQGALVSA